MEENKNIVVYTSKDGQASFEVSVFDDTVWLTQNQMAALFDTSVPNINQHIKSILRANELENSTIKKFLILRKEGRRKVNREIDHYNLDMIICVGYRVQSKRATQFRQWAIQVLKQYMLNGYAINEPRLRKIEDSVEKLLTSEAIQAKEQKEIKQEIKRLQDMLLELVKRPIQINQQLTQYHHHNLQLGSRKLEKKLIEYIDNLIVKTDSASVRQELTTIKEDITNAATDKKAQNRILRFFADLGDPTSTKHKALKGAGITKGIIIELVKLGSKFRDLF